MEGWRGTALEVNMACSRRHFCTLVLLDTLRSTSILRGARRRIRPISLFGLPACACLPASPSLSRGYATRWDHHGK